MFTEIRDINGIQDDILVLNSIKNQTDEKSFLFPKFNYDFGNEMLVKC